MVKTSAASEATTPEKTTATRSKQVAPKKESAGAASKRKSKVSTTAKPVKKKKSDTPFWAPFAKKEKPAPVEERDERPGRRENRDERPERGATAEYQRNKRDERPAPDRQRREEHPSRGQAVAGKPFQQRFEQRPNADGSERPRRDAVKSEGQKAGKAKFAKRKTMGQYAPAPKGHTPTEMEEPMRLNKFLAHCGIAARRQAAEYVKKGMVTVNGATENNPSYTVQPNDEVRFKGEVVRLEARKVYILMNKPRDIITTSSDEKGRRTVLDIIGNKVEERIFPVGRLDRMTSGLLLLTNDGDLAKKLSHPSHKVQKVYHVTLDKPFHKADFEKVQKGLALEDGLAMVDSLHYIEGKKDELEIGIHIGKNRIVRRIFEHLGYEVVKLDRTYYAGLTKKDIGRGHFRHLTEQEVVMLKHFK
jgi:23S rRNA pseudouridine2605 synthase